MKKVLLVFLTITTMFLITGCTTKNIEGNLEDLMAKVYQDLPEEERPMMLTNIEVTDENVEYYLGTADIEYEEALASESAVGSIAHSVVLVRVKDGADVNSVMNTIKENVNPRKWICVGVEKDEVIVKNRGNLIILIIAQDNKDVLEKGFDNL